MGNGGINDVWRIIIKGTETRLTGATWRERFFHRISVKTGGMAVRPMDRAKPLLALKV